MLIQISCAPGPTIPCVVCGVYMERMIEGLGLCGNCFETRLEGSNIEVPECGWGRQLGWKIKDKAWGIVLNVLPEQIRERCRHGWSVPLAEPVAPKSEPVICGTCSFPEPCACQVLNLKGIQAQLGQ